MPQIDPELLQILACPCEQHGQLSEVAPGEDAGEEGGLRCASCRRIFPIREGIPVLLLDEAIER